jgi:HAE1 family hydrophobic/amphiphilic exporter-1
MLGGQGGGAVNRGGGMLHLKPRAERTRTADQIIAALRPKLAQVPGIRVFLTNPPPITIGGLNTRGVYQFTLQDTGSADDLYRDAPILEARIRQLPGFEDVNSDLQLATPQVKLVRSRQDCGARPDGRSG